MKTLTIHAAVLCAAAWWAGQAAAECGAAATYTPATHAQGEQSKQPGMMAAHQSLPPGTRVIVRNQKNGRSIVVDVVRQNPTLVDRIIGLTADAMNALGMEAPAPVCVEVVSYGSERRGYQKFTMRNPFAAPAKQIATAVHKLIATAVHKPAAVAVHKPVIAAAHKSVAVAVHKPLATAVHKVSFKPAGHAHAGRIRTAAHVSYKHAKPHRHQKS